MAIVHKLVSKLYEVGTDFVRIVYFTNFGVVFTPTNSV